MRLFAESYALKTFTNCIRSAGLHPAAAGMVCMVGCLAGPAWAEQPAATPEKVCERYLRNTQEHILPDRLTSIREQCLARAAEFPDRAIGYVFGRCLRKGRAPTLFTDCMSDSLAERDRFASLVDTGRGELHPKQAPVTLSPPAFTTDAASETLTPAMGLPAEIPIAALTQSLDDPLTAPVDAEALIDALLLGESIEDVSVRGLHPGMQVEAAREILTRDWAYAEAESNSFTPFNPDAFSETNRDGGEVRLFIIDDQLGQIKYREHYRVLLDVNDARKRLVKRFGEPDKDKASRLGWLLAWSSYPTRLQVKVVNQSGGVVGFQSTIEIALWSREYEAATVAREQRCQMVARMSPEAKDLAERSAETNDCPGG